MLEILHRHHLVLGADLATHHLEHVETCSRRHGLAAIAQEANARRVVPVVQDVAQQIHVRALGDRCEEVPADGRQPVVQAERPCSHRRRRGNGGHVVDNPVECGVDRHKGVQERSSRAADIDSQPGVTGVDDAGGFRCRQPRSCR